MVIDFVDLEHLYSDGVSLRVVRSRSKQLGEPNSIPRAFVESPEHLQLISQRENNAEMLQRNYFLDRIRRLEEALAEWCPLHPLLGVDVSVVSEVRKLVV